MDKIAAKIDKLNNVLYTLLSKEVIFMDCFYGKGCLNTDKISEEYISVNNFGYAKHIDQNLCIKRSEGRHDYQIIYIDKGYGYFLIEDNFDKVESGNIILLRPGEKNHYEFYSDSLTDYYWIHFSGYGVPELLSSLKLQGSIFSVGDFFEFEKMIESMGQATAIADFTTDIFLSSCIYMLLAKISKNVYFPENPINKILVRMQNEKLNSLTNSDYARMCNLSKYHFLRTFKKHKGMTPHQYMVKITINKAIELLSDTNLNISEISQILGFEDQLYFSRFFKKETGFSPKNYIKEYFN